jgi:hypothetical protein
MGNTPTSMKKLNQANLTKHTKPTKETSYTNYKYSKPELTERKYITNNKNIASAMDYPNSY